MFLNMSGFEAFRAFCVVILDDIFGPSFCKCSNVCVDLIEELAYVPLRFKEQPIVLIVV